jgi:hypothetical protein
MLCSVDRVMMISIKNNKIPFNFVSYVFIRCWLGIHAPPGASVIFVGVM